MIKLSALDKDLITVSKIIVSESNINKGGTEVFDKYYKYRLVVSKHLLLNINDVSDGLLLRKLGKVYDKLLKSGYISLADNYENISDLYLEHLIHFKSCEDILNTFIAEIQWLDIPDESENLLLNSHFIII